MLFGLIKGGFSQRRKVFLNSVESYLNFYGIEKQDFIEVLSKHNIDSLRRAETISLEEFISITNDINDKIIKE